MTKTRLRLAALALVLGLLLLLGQLTGAREWMTEERLQRAVLEAGWWGLVLFFVVFTVGQLVQVPGVVFIIVARVVWGPVVGLGLAYAGSVLSAAAVFMLVRAVGGKPLDELTWPPARRVLAGLDRRPVVTIAALRVAMMLAPPLTYALALSPVKQRDHLFGSALGLAVPVTVVVFLSEAALALWRSL